MTEKVDVSKQLVLLIGLQDIDGHIYRLKGEKEAKPDEIAELKASLENKKSGMEQADAELKAFQVQHKDKETELGLKEENVKKLQTQLYQIKTNKEYTAMLHEIEQNNADNSLLEEEIIKLMDAIDAAKAKVGQEKKKFEEEQKKVGTGVKAIEQRVNEIDANLAELQKKRGELIPSIDAKILSNYERVLSGRDGKALAEVVNDACGGCYMQLPPQVINEIKIKERIIHCENCQRILYIKEEQA